MISCRVDNVIRFHVKHEDEAGGCAYLRKDAGIMYALHFFPKKNFYTITKVPIDHEACDHIENEVCLRRKIVS